MFYLSLSFLPRDKICFHCIHAREGVVLKKALLREAPPQGPTPFPLYQVTGSCLGTGHYLSRWGRGRRILGRGGEGHLIFRRTKGGSVVTVNPKGYH